MYLPGHFQNGYVTRDLERAVAMFAREYGVHDFVYDDAEVVVTTPGGEGTARFRVALAWAGDRQVELIQPESGPVGLYLDALPADDSLRFHHMGMRCDSLEPIRAEAARRGWPIAMAGSVPGIDFMYIDAAAQLGHHLEYMCATPEAWEGMRWPEGLAVSL